MARDCGFRALLLSFYYGTTEVRHKPIQKYSMPQIVDFMKERRAVARARGEAPETHRELSYLFYEFHNYEVKSHMATRITLLLAGNLVATLLTNPFDVCLSKLATQQPEMPFGTTKYRGFLNCLTTVYKEEGLKKLFLGGIHPRFMFNAFNGMMFLFIYDRFIYSISASQNAHGPYGKSSIL